MTVENKDVIRVFDTPANLAANLKDNMIGGDTTNFRFAGKWPGNIMKYVSDDTQQVLIAGAQSITGLKTFEQNIIMTTNKLLTIDQVSGFRPKTASINTISPDDSAYAPNALLNVLGGDIDVLDHTVLTSNVLNADSTFTSISTWNPTADVTISGGKCVYLHGTGAASIDSLVAGDSFFPRTLKDQWYVFEFDVDAIVGSPTMTIQDDFGMLAALNVPLIVGSSQKFYYKTDKYTNGGSFWAIDFASTTAGESITLDNVTVRAIVGGSVNAYKYGPNESMHIDSEGNVDLIFNGGFSGSGWIGGGNASKLRTGLKFASEGDAEFSHSLKIGAGGGGDALSEGNRYKIPQLRTTQTNGAITGIMGNTLSGADFTGGTYIILVNGVKDDGTLGFSQVFFGGCRKVSGNAILIAGFESVTKMDDFGDVSAVVSMVGSSLRVTVTGSAGDIINWTTGIFGAGGLNT